MIGQLFRRSSASAGAVPTGAAAEPQATLLVIQEDAYDWAAIFSGRTLANGRCIRVYQTGWRDMHVQADNYSSSPVLVTVKRVEGRAVTIRPDFVLIRNEVRECTSDWRSLLYGLMFGGVGSVNSLMSVYAFCERPVVQAALNELSRACVTRGESPLPLVTQQYFATHREMMYGQAYPCVVKVGHAHAGMGKMRLQSHHDFADFRSVQALTGTYSTAEPFVPGAHDVRVQKIGAHLRAYRRVSVSGEWKTNTGTAAIEEIEVTEEYRRWAETAATMFGGLDILTVDAVHDECTGEELILEVNGTSSGLLPERAEEDNGHIRDLVLARMNELFP